MVSRKQHILIIAILGSLAQAAAAENPGKKFYSDDPLWREPAPRTQSHQTRPTTRARREYAGRGSRQRLVHQPALEAAHVDRRARARARQYDAAQPERI